MNSYIIHKYVHLCALDGLKEKHNNYNFRCPICGDSQKSKSKQRGWILTKDNGNMATYTCHNCGATMSFGKFLKQYKPFLYDDYKKEAFYEKVKHRNIPTKETNVLTNGHDTLKEVAERSKSKSILKLLDGLTDESIQLCKERRLPIKFINELYYSENYLKFVNDNGLREIKKFPPKDKRIVIPFFDENGNLTYIQGRAIDKNNSLRYVTIKVNGDVPKIWGMDRIDPNKPIFVTEGVLDAVFVDNCLAMAGGKSGIDYLINKYGARNLIMLYDRDIETNPEIKNYATELVNKGLGIFLWDEVKRKHIKDINDLRMDGCPISSINKMIRRNIYHGIQAKVKLRLL